MKALPVAAQVYSVRQEAEADFAGTMKRLAEMGYEGVELAGLYGKTPAQIRRELEDAGLKAVSAHVPIEAFLEDLEGTLDDYQALGCQWVAIPWLAEERRFGGEKYQETLEFLPKIAEGCRKRGMALLYHNHDFEFAKTPDGEYHLNRLYKDVPDSVLGAEPDTCWIKVAGVDPEAWLEEHKGRCPLVHIKDYRREGGEAVLVALGEGEQKLPELVRTAQECGAQWLIVEQDDHPYGTPMGNMEKSIKYLKENC